MEFVVYDTCENLIWNSGEGRRNKNKTTRSLIPKTHIKKVSPSSTLGFVCSPQNYTCDILSEYLVSCRFQAY